MALSNVISIIGECQPIAIVDLIRDILEAVVTKNSAFWDAILYKSI
jgi:hypothetical protein